MCKTLKAHYPQIKIIGLDINPIHLIATGEFLDSFYQVPYSDSKEFPGYFLKILQKELPRYVWPTLDKDQFICCGLSEKFLELGIQNLGIPPSTLPLYVDKLSMNSFLRENGFPVPKKFELTEVEEDKKYFIKPLNGFGSQGAKIVDGKELLGANQKQDILIQEICTPPEVTLECFIYDIARKFSELVRTPYLFNLQFMKNNSNQWVITDVNLRTAGGMALSCCAGWNVVRSIGAIICKEPMKKIQDFVPQLVPQTYAVRSYIDIATAQSKKVVAFDLDGTLLDTWRRQYIALHLASSIYCPTRSSTLTISS